MNKKANQNPMAERLSKKLKEIRKSLHYSGPKMADALGLGRATYYRNELGRNYPGIRTILILAKKYNISIDWFLCDRGRMIYKEAGPVVMQQVEPGNDEYTLSVDEKELISNMRQVPLLRHELMAYLYKYKEEHPDKFNQQP